MNKYIIIEWPEIQEYMSYEGFRENACLINDESWLDQYGSSSYFVNESWINQIDKKLYGNNNYL